ncbi:MAG: 3-hydroxyacyl-CoA dehydrogenase NAD-binding domain-containing protein [Acidobacteriota bacterium]
MQSEARAGVGSGRPAQIQESGAGVGSGRPAPIQKAAVIGAGVMGSGIAAQIANAGFFVHLLDIVPDGAEDRSVLAKEALKKAAKADPAPFMSKRAMKLVEPGNLEDDLDKLKDVDWIVEVVVENLEIKQALYRKIAEVKKPGAIVSSNTSTLPLAKLTEGLPESLVSDFLITHFFNPPRYLRLLEVVAGPTTNQSTLEAVASFGDKMLGKTVIRCKDTPGFVGNRIGVYWMQAAFTEAFAMNLPIEEADAAMGRPLGIPKTGIFGLADLVGIDLLPYVAGSLRQALPSADGFHAIDKPLPRIEAMIEAGYTGRKGKGGFYRLNREGGGRVKEAMDLATGEYATAQKPRLEGVEAARKGGPRALFDVNEPASGWAWEVMSKTLAYAASLVGEIADDITQIDAAMRLGYAWKWGPFELLDKIGPAWFRQKLAASGVPCPSILEKVGDGTFYRVEEGRLQYLTVDGAYADVVRPEGVTLLEDIKRVKEKPLLKNGGASLWDIGDGVACFEIHTKMNAIDPDVLDLLAKSIGHVEKNMKALVIYNEGSNFSAGANIGLALFAANTAVWPMVEDMVAKGQKTYRKLKYAPFPVVAAPSGMALGGGCEICLNADAIQACGETYMGLVEVGVGVIPGWTGSTEMVQRWMTREKRPGGPMPAISKVFETIGMAEVAKSAAEAKEKLFLREGDGITMNRDRLLADAKAKALGMVEGYQPPEPKEISLPGPTAKIAMGMAVEGFRLQGKATPHDEVVATELATILSGGDTDITETVTDDQLLKLERQAFMKLIRTPASLARIEHMLETGKPLRN